MSERTQHFPGNFDWPTLKPAPLHLLNGTLNTTEVVVASAREFSVGNRWMCDYHFAVEDGQLIVHSLAVMPMGQRVIPGGVPSDVLRQVSPQRAVQEAIGFWEWLTDDVSKPLDDLDPSYGSKLSHIERLIQDFPEDVVDLSEPTDARRGRPPVADAFLAEVARVYMRERAAGRGVYRRMLRHNEISRRQPSSTETIRSWVRMARERGLLPKGDELK